MKKPLKEPLKEPLKDPFADLKERLAIMYGRPFPNLKCMTCLHNALDDEYAGQITDDEELDQLHMQRREKMRQRVWERRLAAQNGKARPKK